MPDGRASVIELLDRRVDLVRQVVLFPDGRTTALTTREAQLLGYLAERPEQDVSRDELLDRVWSYRATYATRAVDVTMRRLRAKVEPDPQEPVHLISVHGVGYRFVPPPRPAAPAPAPAPSPLPRTNLRAERTTFVGRAAERELLGRLLADGARLVSVLGPGGVGKSRLAARVAADTLERWPGGVWWCDLEAAVGLEGVLSAVADTVGVALTGGEEVRRLGRALAGRGPLLLVLDGFERHAALAAETVGRWLSDAPEARFVVTSRERLRLTGEQVVELAALPAADARALFLDRADAAGAALAAADRGEIDRLVERLDHLPLAIELAAPKARVLSLQQLHQRLDERFQLLSSSGRDGRPLRVVLDQSWELLDPAEQKALAWCGVFVGGFTLEAAEVVIGDAEDRWALDLVEALRDKSLLRVLEPAEAGGELRLGLYESVRDYALERLAERGETAFAEARHAAYYVALGTELALGLDRHGGLARMARLQAERDNLLAVARRRAGEERVRAVLALEPLLATRGPTAVLRRLCDPAITEAAGEPLARLLLARGHLRRLAGDMDGAREDAGRALALVRESGEATEATALTHLALLDTDASRLDEAEALARAGLEVARAGGHRTVEGVLLGLLGALASMRGRPEEAERRYLEAIRIAEEVGNERRAALDLANLGLLLSDAGRVDEAEPRLRESLRLHTLWGNTRRRATTHGALALLRGEQGRIGEAIGHAEEALRLFREEGYTRFAALTRQNLATLRWAAGTAADALPGLRDAAAELREVGDRLGEGMAHAWLAAALASDGRPDPAADALAAARDRLEGLHNPQADGLLLLAGAFLARARGDLEAARRTAAHGAESALLGVRFMARLLRRELDR